jgi:putative peptidoglycan lipid II flippase
MVKIIVPAFYALHDTRTPVKVAFFAMLINVALNLVFLRPLQNGGPALATSLSALFNSLSLLTIFYRRYGSFGVSGIMHSVLKFGIASVALGAVAYGVIHWPGLYGGRVAQKAAALALAIGSSVATYFAVAFLLQSPELAELSVMRRAKAAPVNEL